MLSYSILFYNDLFYSVLCCTIIYSSHLISFNFILSYLNSSHFLFPLLILFYLFLLLSFLLLSSPFFSFLLLSSPFFSSLLSSQLLCYHLSYIMPVALTAGLALKRFNMQKAITSTFWDLFNLFLPISRILWSPFIIVNRKEKVSEV